MPRAITEEPKYGYTGRKIWRNATESVLRNLQTSKPGDVTYEPVGCGFRMDGVDEYRECAMDYLTDKSELALRTMERADWDEVYRFFRAYGKDSHA
jgi:hypothetical protein